MKTEWIWSLETEAQRIIFTAKQTYNGFYQSSGFIVLPPEYLKLDSDIVVFPKISIDSISGFWKKVAKADILDRPVLEDKALIGSVVHALRALDIKEPDLGRVKQLWSRAQKELMDQIYEVLGKKDLVQKLIIYPTHFGTSVSFNPAKTFPATLEIFLRFDQDIYSIVEGILSSLLGKELVEEYSASWREREFLVDWLVRNSSISKILKQSQPTTQIRPTTHVIHKKQYSKLRQHSASFIKKLNLPADSKKKLTVKQFSLYLGSNNLRNLSWKERRVLILLTQQKGEVVAKESIAEVIFRDDDHYSLYAMAKFIQRLREKLEENDFPGNQIETVRGRGYLLK